MGHAFVRRSGFQRSDILFRDDDQNNFYLETDLIANGMSHTKPEEKVEVEVIRQGFPIRIQLHITKVDFPRHSCDTEPGDS